MRHRSNVTIPTLATALLAVLAGAALQAAPASAAGLSVSPATVEHLARGGGVGSVTVANTTSGSLTIKVAARPWVQALSGSVAPNRARALSDVKLSATSFTLAAGAHRAVGLSYTGKAGGASQYGCIEVTGVPQSRSARGITVAYRLISTLRLNPSRKSFKAQVTSLGATGRGKHSLLAIMLHNSGNTVEPIGGTVRLQGPDGSSTDRLRAVRIVPGASVRLTLQSLAKTASGAYTASVQITQGGVTVVRFNRRLTLP